MLEVNRTHDDIACEIVLAWLPHGSTLLGKDLPSGDQARKVFIFKEDGYRIEDTPLYPAEHNLVRQDLQIKINPDETIEAQKQISSLGIYDQGQRYWFLYTQPKLIEETLKEKIQETSIGARLKHYYIENLDNLDLPVVLKYSFEGPEYFTSAGSLRIMPQLASIDSSLAAREERRYPEDFGVLDSKETNFEFQIPQNLALKYIPESFTEDSPWMRFSAQYQHKNNKLYFKQKTEVKKITVLESEYPDFKKFLERAAKKFKQRIVLERI
jgi:hypothetical protein